MSERELCELEAGDAVALRGTDVPVMTIESVAGMKAYCVWIDRFDIVRREPFALVTLRKWNGKIYE